ncbi:sensor histidine kinase [Paludibaculum fermentans]|uniref:Histidine kinase n=1 Tax=Paludibaculum fermentans TaxID=1473598 RepID=A0A7S7NRR6_PALFE|nr:histidine kinase [Paludibaculum fermentans]QOY88515.1 histidine kinase [Paludibaculum fermentans]
MYSARTYWLCQILGWTAWTIANGAVYGAYTGNRQPSQMFATVWFGLAGFLGSHCLRLWIRRAGWVALPILPGAARALGAAIVTSTGVTLASLVVMIYVFHFLTWEITRFTGYVVNILFWTAVFSLWLALYFGAHYFARSRRAELHALQLDLTAREASFLALRAQLNPHFLFNCLNSIRALISEDPPRAQHAVTMLSSLLRYTLQSGERADVPLSEELDMVDEYLALELIRFEDRLKVQRDIPPAALAARLPPMLLQTLVENALKHGIARQTSGGTVSIAAALDHGRLELRVANPGTLAPEPGATGIGLENARRRLNLRYGDRAILEVSQQTSPEGPVVLATVSVPQ